MIEGRDVELGLIHEVFIRARPKSLRLGYLHWKKVTDSIRRKHLFDVTCIKHFHTENLIGNNFEKLKLSYMYAIKVLMYEYKVVHVTLEVVHVTLF